MKKLILGKGKVSSIICDENTTVLTKEECDITDLSQVKTSIRKINPDVIINCAAKTNLEYCQDNKLECFESNVLGVVNLLTVCEAQKIKLVHISSGCLFDGNHFVASENTQTSPAVWYTWTKNWADETILNYGFEDFLILRPRQLISKVPHPTNMLTKFASMESIPSIVEDNSITCIEDLRDMLEFLLSKNATGIYNCANEGTVTPYDIAVGVKKHINPNLKVEKASYESLLKKLPNRRVNTILDISKLKSLGYHPKKAQEALDWCLENYGK